MPGQARQGEMVRRWNSKLGYHVCSPEATGRVRLRAQVRALDSQRDGQILGRRYGLKRNMKIHEDSRR